MENMITDGVYLHINNGGVSFKVTDDDFLSLEIGANHFGNVTNYMKLFVSPENLKQLGQMLIDASEKEAKVCEYLSLESRVIDKDTRKTKRFDGRENVSHETQQQDEAAAGTTASDEDDSATLVMKALQLPDDGKMTIIIP